MKKLYLSSADSKLYGVCGGIAEFFNIDSTIIRLLWIVLTFASGILIGIIAYIVALLIIPRKDRL